MIFNISFPPAPIQLEKVMMPQMPQASIAVAPTTPTPPTPTPFIATAPTESITGVADEYDPFKPNEYDDVVKKMKKEREREMERERRREERKERERDRDRDRDNNR